MVKLFPLFSGSSGNCYYIRSGTSGILLDAGRSAKQITEMLSRCEIDPKSLQGIFVTHEHTDHIQGLRVFAARHGIPVYGSAGTLQVLESAGHLAKCRYEPIGRQGIACGDLQVTPFPTQHDCAESTGYTIETHDGHRITLATDLGTVTEPVQNALRGSDFVILESNHDVGMLRNGFYPYPLKQRILSDYGHLSNETCASLLPELIENGTTRILLAHLSHENNTPELALQTSLCQLQLHGMQENVDFQLFVAPRENTMAKILTF